MRGMWESCILIILFITFPQRGMAMWSPRYQEQSTSLFHFSGDPASNIIDPTTQHNQTSHNDDIVTVDKIDSHADALIEFANFVYDSSKKKKQTIEYTLSKKISELNESDTVHVTPNSIKHDKDVYLVVVKPSENNDFNQFLIKSQPLKDVSSFLKTSDIYLWASTEGIRIDEKSSHELRDLDKLSIGLLTTQYPLSLKNNCDTSFVLYLPCSVKDAGTNDNASTYYEVFLFIQDDYGLLKSICLLSVRDHSDDINKDVVAEGGDNDTLYSKRVSETTNAGNYDSTSLSWGEMYSCNTCDKTFNDHSRLEIHMLIHSENHPYSCGICYKKFRSNSYITTHMRIHTEDKSYICTICNMTFTSNSILNQHMRIHNDEKAYNCIICDKNFRQNAHLKRHVRIHTGDKPYNCEICHKKFPDQANCAKHKLIHTDNKPHTCKICGNKFRRKDHLISHLLSHSSDTHYICDICGNVFAYKCNLQTHIRIHTGEKPYGCKTCDKKFRLKYQLKKHRLTDPQCQLGYRKVHYRDLEKK
ncbi:MAG: C2H2-type zinc finger protein [Candidatus Endonucleobacter bathymodioli]|uniref:C2H2-type zinc finger protein n=1 Tax=Candidatus Endonucleibacter bathymodioli TaxID=539814 RepID=A0AA90SSY0_9GAMM|nr:C2H2-type zinc finger protein [Candidatus Endonucleobacter bathymodioli]